jgi:hypothetical protein
VARDPSRLRLRARIACSTLVAGVTEEFPYTDYRDETEHGFRESRLTYFRPSFRKFMTTPVNRLQTKFIGYLWGYGHEGRNCPRGPTGGRTRKPLPGRKAATGEGKTNFMGCWMFASGKTKNGPQPATRRKASTPDMLTLNLPKREKTKNGGIPGKRLNAAWNQACLLRWLGLDPAPF